MGEVFRARDIRLGREVALKVLPEALAQDRERLARFEQEARAASALNHPNIVTIHEIGREGETTFIAMELVDGKTLRELELAGAMPVRKILGVAAQVAEGLAKAHAAGIVHRDLKPENVMVSKDGFVKILDFGLAKLVEPQSGEVSAMPTMAEPRDARRNGAGHGGLHVAGAGLGRAPGLSVGSVLAGLDALRDVDGAEGVPEEDGGGDDVGDHPGGAGARREAAPGSSAAGALDAGSVSRQGSRGALRLDRGSRPGSRERAGPHLGSLERRGGDACRDGKARPASDPAPGSRGRAGRGLDSGWVARGARLVERTTGVAHVPATDVPPGPARQCAFRPGRSDGRLRSAVARGSRGSMQLYQTRLGNPESRTFDFRGDILAISSSNELAIDPVSSRGALGTLGTLARVPLSGGTPRPVLENVAYAGADFSPEGQRARRRPRRRRARHGWSSPRARCWFPRAWTGPAFRRTARGSRSGTPRGRPDLGRPRRPARQVEEDLSRPISSALRARPAGGRTGRRSGSPVPDRASRDALWGLDLSGRRRLVMRVPGDLELDDISQDGRVLISHHTLTRHGTRGLGRRPKAA